MAKRAGSTTIEIGGSHVAFIAHPEQVARVIEQAARRSRRQVMANYFWPQSRRTGLFKCRVHPWLKHTPTIRPTSRDNILAVGQRIMSGKGFSAVGLNEILTEAKVPKGSFYHYFNSKDAFGEALLSNYFEDYLADIDAVMAQPGLTMAQRLLNYFAMWRDNQSFLDCQGKCLAVKLAAEVADLSEAMRGVLNQGTPASSPGWPPRSNAVSRKVRWPSTTTRGWWRKAFTSCGWAPASWSRSCAAPNRFDSAMAVTRQMLRLPH